MNNNNNNRAYAKTQEVNRTEEEEEIAEHTLGDTSEQNILHTHVWIVAHSNTNPYVSRQFYTRHQYRAVVRDGRRLLNIESPRLDLNALGAHVPLCAIRLAFWRFFFRFVFFFLFCFVFRRLFLLHAFYWCGSLFSSLRQPDSYVDALVCLSAADDCSGAWRVCVCVSQCSSRAENKWRDNKIIRKLTARDIDYRRTEALRHTLLLRMATWRVLSYSSAQQ